MSSQKVGFQETLASEVVAPSKCIGCGACVVVCPFGCLEYVEEKPRLAKECKLCGLCAKVCPRYEWTFENAERFVPPSPGVGGWAKFIKTSISVNKPDRHRRALLYVEPVREKQQPKKGGRGWLHK